MRHHFNFYLTNILFWPLISICFRVCVYECIIRVWCVFIFSAIEIYKIRFHQFILGLCVCVCIWYLWIVWLDFHTKFCVAQAKNKSV